MDAANVHDPVSIPNDRDSAILPFGGHEAAHTNLASRGLPYDGPGALATIPEEPPSNSGAPDPCAGDSSGSSGCPELRFGESLDGPGYFTRGGLLDYYGYIDGVAQWDRAKVYDSGDNAGGSDGDDDDAVGPHEDEVHTAGSRR